jgi:K+/H+ antiporter YhaU regulatory subunit KhtT
MANTSTETRSYGAGAAGSLTSVPVNTPPSRREVWRYRFDNSLFKNPYSFIWWLIIATAVMTGVTTVVWVVLQPVADLSAIDGFLIQFFDAFNIIFFGNGPSMATWVDRLFAMFCWFISTATTATIIAMATTMIGNRMDALKRGKSSILEQDHTLILGWSTRIFPILSQLAIANENIAKPVVVIFADMDREVMDTEIHARVGDLKNTTIVTRTGDPSNPRDLARAAADKAKSIIILDEDDTGDSAIVTAILAVRAVAPHSTANIIVEIDDIEHAAALAHATNGQVVAVQAQDVIARVTAQASRQPGLAAVILDLLDFDGDEIYFADATEVVGRTFGDVLTAFEKASVIGLLSYDDTIMINPDVKRRITHGDQLIALAEDDDRIIFTGYRDDLANVTAVTPANQRTQHPEHLLVIGWSTMGHAVLSELGSFLPAGSSIHVMANPELVDTSGLDDATYGTVPVRFTKHDGSVAQIAQIASARKYDEIIVLGYRETVAVDEADSHTMMTMLLLNKLFAEEGNGVEPTRLVAEILDSRRSELARVASADDLVVSDNLAALMMAQLAENSRLAPVFTDLFDVDGASVNVKPIELYAPTNDPITYAELVAAARSRGEAAIGYRINRLAKSDPAGGVRLNPAKSSVFNAEEGDGLIIVGDAAS